MIRDTVKVLRIVEQPAKNDNSPFSTYGIELEYGPGCVGKAHLRRDEYEAFLLERKILEKGVPFKLLEEYRDKIREITSFDESIDNNE